MIPSKREQEAARVLVVDDECEIARMLVGILERGGYSCGTASSAQEAEELMREQEYDVVLTEMDLPGGSGLTLISKLRHDYPNVATLMVTDLDEPLLAHAALEVGAYGYRTVPTEPKGWGMESDTNVPRQGKSEAAADTIVSLRAAWTYSLRAENKAPSTVAGYDKSLGRLFEFTGGRAPTRQDIRAYLDEQIRVNSPGTAVVRYRGIRSFYRWCASEGLEDPMSGIKEPKVPERPVPVLTDDELERLLEACGQIGPNRGGGGLGFCAVRDRAIIRLFIGSGLRLGEVAGISTDDVNAAVGTVRVLGKGSRPRTVGLSQRTVEALEAYQWVREVHRHSSLDALWLGPYGALSAGAIYKMIRRRGDAAGVSVHPHSLRHVFADRWLRAGGQEHDLMKITGWRNSKMVARYAASTAVERALKAQERLGVGESLGECLDCVSKP